MGFTKSKNDATVHFVFAFKLGFFFLILETINSQILCVAFRVHARVQEEKLREVNTWSKIRVFITDISEWGLRGITLIVCLIQYDIVSSRPS